jgi:asparagine synthase (glutamine-hydrolysing)
VLGQMSQAQKHRGPDDSGEWLADAGDWTLGLGQQRLSIIDLSAAGHQPMVHPDTGNIIVFNGEIYNFQQIRKELQGLGHRFVGHSDTEVLLHALTRWGTECLLRIEGMYAFAFFDNQRKRLILARDPLGIKPLYVAHTQQGLIFASEVRAILCSGLVARKINRVGVAGLLAYGAMQHPHTLVEGVESFPPGHYQVVFEDGCLKERGQQPVAFWRFPEPLPRTEGDVINDVRNLVERSVRNHLISDVPVGVFLSSGIDSTVVTSVAARLSPRIRTFTVGFADQPDMSECRLAAETAKLLGTEHTEILINGPDAEASSLQWLKSLDQPSLDGLNVYIISRAVRQCGIKVALSGQGGDELFGGYPSFIDVQKLARLMAGLRVLPRSIRRVLGRGAMAGRSQAVKQKFFDVLDTDGSICQLYFQRRRAMSSDQLRLLNVTPERLGLMSCFHDTRSLGDVPESGDAVWLISQLESRFYQGNMLLRDGDANSMSHSLEIRVPLLDQRLAHYVLSLPGRVRLPHGRADKHLLRVAFASDFRTSLLRQDKRGFTLPIRRWMLGPLRDLCVQGLESLKARDLVAPAGVDAIWRQYQQEPESPVWSRAFTLVVLGAFIEQHGLN